LLADEASACAVLSRLSPSPRLPWDILNFIARESAIALVILAAKLLPPKEFRKELVFRLMPPRETS